MFTNTFKKTLLSVIISGVIVAACGGGSSDSSDSSTPAVVTDPTVETISLSRIGRTASQGFAVSASEIVAFDKTGKRIFTVNAESGAVDVFDASNVTAPVLNSSLNLAQILHANGKVSDVAVVGAANSIAISGDLVAVAVEANPKTSNGWVVFLNRATLTYVQAVQVGALPDMVTFTPDGTKSVVAIEGEPEDYTVDPEGRVDIINVSDFSLRSATFTAFNVGGARHSELPSDVRVFGQVVDSTGAIVRSSTVAEDLEPEYVAISDDSKTAYVSLQEANAIAVVDLTAANVTKIISLGFKNHSLAGNGLDPSDKDSGATIGNWPVYGMYMPDSIASYQVNGQTYLVTANEGDSRADWGVEDASGDNVNNEETRVKNLSLDTTVFTDATTLKMDANLGRLKVTTKLGDANGDGLYEKLFAFGGRSFSIWNATTGALVFDSGDAFEKKTAEIYGNDFNNNHEENDGDGRSDDKGPEPEALAIGKIYDKTYAFVGLERMGGIMVYDITNPAAPTFVQYLNDRNLVVDPADNSGSTYSVDAGDLGPEGFKFVSASDSPNGKPLLIVGNEVSGTTAIHEIAVTTK
ncbi:choice-of-anchor I family protein [Propionivibrio limicola]|uniref:choice-of-anchor I family protein n=1 Tax=Propionivibrio limicola TaxID=167645 RepID=UPI001290F68F|nr:choice-of-anchor I family protein [Propionivibrio limicola]